MQIATQAQRGVTLSRSCCRRSLAAARRQTLFNPRWSQQEVQAPWEFASQLEQGGDSAVCTVRELLAAKKEEVLRTLQRQVRWAVGARALCSQSACICEALRT